MKGRIEKNFMVNRLDWSTACKKCGKTGVTFPDHEKFRLCIYCGDDQERREPTVDDMKNRSTKIHYT